MREQATHKTLVLLAIILMNILVETEVDLFVPSFPELKNQFALSAFWVEALLSANFIGYCLSVVFAGSLADRYGRKQIIIVGLLVFIIGSVICVFAASYKSLVIGRFLQGMGIAAPSTLSFIIITDLCNTYLLC